MTLARLSDGGGLIKKRWRLARIGRPLHARVARHLSGENKPWTRTAGRELKESKV